MNQIGSEADRNPPRPGVLETERVARVLIVAGSGSAGIAIASAAGLEKPARIVVGPSDARAALDEPWDLIIIDACSPEMDGVALIRAHAGPDRRFLATGVDLDLDTAVEAMRLGAVDCALTARLERAVSRVLERSEPRHERTDLDWTPKLRVRPDASEETGGGAAGLFGTVEEVTELERTASELRQSREALSEAQRIARLTQWSLDIGTDLIEVRESPGWRLDAGTISAQQLLQRIAPDDRMRVARALQQAILGNPYNVEYRMATARGEAVVHAVGELRKNATGFPIALVGTVQDVTELRATQEALFRTQREFKAIVDATGEGIIATDLAGIIKLANPAACNLLGLEIGEIVGRGVHDVLHRSCPSRGKKACPLENGVGAAQPIRLHDETLSRKESHPFAAQLAVSPILEKGSLRGMVLSFSDMSEQRLLEAELERADRLVSLGRVAATMAHEFNNVLMGIQPFAEIIRRKTVDPASLNAVAHIERSIERGRNITHQILRFTRSSEPQGRPVESGPLLEGIQQRLSALMPEGIALDIFSDEDLVMFLDREQVEQAVTNLAINARDSIGDQGVIEIRLTRCLSGEVYSFGVVPTSDRFAHLRVADTGAGMDVATLKQIFEPFFTTKKGGTGLGLAIVHQIVRNHGGHVFAEGAPGEGMIFHLFLPLADPMDLGVEAETAELGGGIRGPQILLVEDDESVADGLGSNF